MKTCKNGTQYDCGFSPKMGSQDAVVAHINTATESIYMATYSFTSKVVMDALMQAKDRGVEIHVVSDEVDNIKPSSVTKLLALNGISVRLNKKYHILHHKFIIVDETHLELGSFNYSANAYTSNAENVLVLYNVPELCAEYKVQWDRMWEEGFDWTETNGFTVILKTIVHKVKSLTKQK